MRRLLDAAGHAVFAGLRTQRLSTGTRSALRSVSKMVRRHCPVALVVALGSGLLGVACGGGDSAPTAKPTATSVPDVPAVSAAEADALGLTRRLPSEYRAVCAEQAAYAPGGARTCPPLIPSGRLKVIVAAPFSKQKRYSGGYVADLASRSLSELRGRPIETNGGHWHYDVSWTLAVRRLVVDRGVQRPPNADQRSSCRGSRLGAEDVDVCEVVPYEKGGGLNGGHVAYVWRHERTAYVLSVHGYGNRPRARAMMAALIRTVLD